jgi:phage recombination protein Bet
MSPNALAHLEGMPILSAPTITPDQLTLIKKTIAKDATTDELQLFLYDCQRRGVHPLDRLLHFTKRSGRYMPITSIDFMRIRAAATRECAGIDDVVFLGTPKMPDFTATVSVYRLVQGLRCAFVATARWSEYKPDSDFMWRKMPHTMLGKCAEALALRKGFPQELSGLYAKEELEQAEGTTVNPQTGEIQEAAPPVITAAQRKRLFTIASKAGWSTDQIKQLLLDQFQLDSTRAIPTAQYDDIVTVLSEPPPAPEVNPKDQPF